MDKDLAIKYALKLIERSKVATIGTLDENGYPNIKGMLKISTEGLHTVWFSTLTYSKRTQQIIRNKNGCVYFFDNDSYEGVMLVGDFEVLQNLETKKRFWVEGFEMYYPKGYTDPDYSVLKFTTKTINFYKGLENITFGAELL